MSQSELAEIIETDQCHISAWEGDATLPEEEMVEWLAVVFGASAVELLTGRPEEAPKRTIRLTADNFADHLSTDYAASLIRGYTVPADGIDSEDWIVSKLIAWVKLQNDESPDVKYETPRVVVAVLLGRDA
jgi:transcriptional regulator with XRE-family HTH domain